MKFIIIIIFVLFQTTSFSEESKKISEINLENLPATYEEDKDILEEADLKDKNLESSKYNSQLDEKKNLSDKIYVNLTALDKITAKISSITIPVGEKQNFGQLEIKPLKCQLSDAKDAPDTIVYLQVRDLSSKNNDQVFIFNGWTFASSPTLRSIDHPVYDLWLVSCDNI